MRFKTEYMPRLSERPLDPGKPILLLGSCFTDSIGGRMRRCRWRAYPNPCGVLYNPMSIANTLEIAVNGDDDSLSGSITCNGELWASWLSDSGCTSFSRPETENRLRKRFERLHDILESTRAIIVTFGTAWVYELLDRPGYIVANCHKYPAAKFRRRRLSIEEITKRWMEIARLVSGKYPEIRFIFTVSPIRHLKDGLEGNSRSKAILQLVCERLCEEIPGAEYFPSFEILNDDLRDYRFYADDLVHPSTQGVEYIWEKFLDRYLTAESRDTLEEGEKVTRALEHRPIIYGGCEPPESAASQTRRKALEHYRQFIECHPGMLRAEE